MNLIKLSAAVKRMARAMGFEVTVKMVCGGLIVTSSDPRVSEVVEAYASAGWDVVQG